MPGIRVRVSLNVFELGKCFWPALAWLNWVRVFSRIKIHPESTAINADLCISISTLEFVFLMLFRSIVPSAFEQENWLFLIVT